MRITILLQDLLFQLSFISILCYATKADDSIIPGNGTRPEMPCVFEHESPWKRLKLLDPSDGLPFMNEKGLLKKTTKVLESIPEYNIERVKDTPSDIYDLKLGEEYLALFDDGSLGFAPTSSKGTKAVNNGKKRFMTTIFTISCDGDFSISLPDALNYGFARHHSTKLVYVDSTDDIKHARKKRSTVLPFLERTVAATNHMAEQMNPFAFLVGPTLISDYHQIGYMPRCTAKVPFGLTSTVKPGARPAFFNGCGAENGVKFPDLRFLDCCNNHDLCYDNCSATWENCNEEFRTCNHKACDDFYPYLPNEPWYSVDPVRWGCNILADTYAEGVGTRIGAWAFNISTGERCECKCPKGSLDCGKNCMIQCHVINEDAVVEVRKGEPDNYLIALNGLP